MSESDILTSVRNPWIRQLRQLQKGKGRREQECFLVEGTHLLMEAIATGWPLEAVCFTQSWIDKHWAMADRIAGGRLQLVGEEVLGALATTKTPDGVVAIARMRPGESDQASIRGLNRSVQPTLGIALERLQDPGNVGTLVRSAVAVGATGVWLSEDSVDPFNPKVLRATAGQWFRLPPQLVGLSEQLRVLQAQGVQVLAAAALGSGESERGIKGRSMWEWDLKVPTVFVLGNEGAGLAPEILGLCDGGVSIPMVPGVESLNVGMAGTVLLYEAMRQRQQTGV